MLQDIYVQLYERGVLEAADVKGVQAWIQALQAIGYEGPRDQCQPHNPVLSPSRAPFFSDVAVGVHINHGHLSAIAPWNALWASTFGNVFYNVLQKSGIRNCGAMTNKVKCHYNAHHTVNGDLAQITMADNLVHPFYDNSITKLIWQHDDMLLDYQKVLSRFNDPYCIARSDNSFGMWPANAWNLSQHWWFTPVTRDLVLSLFNHQPNLFRPGSPCSPAKEGNPSFAMAFSDFIFLDVSPRCKGAIANFTTVLEKTVAHGVYLEIAVPTATTCAVPDSVVMKFPVFTSYNPETQRHNATHYSEYFNSSYAGSHPLKVGTPHGLAAQLILRDEMWQAGWDSQKE
jgi:hypothetical protein